MAEGENNASQTDLMMEEERAHNDELLEEESHFHVNHNPYHGNNLDLMDFGRTRRSRMSFVAPDANTAVLFGSFVQENEAASGTETHHQGMTQSMASNRPSDYGSLLQAFDNIVEEEDAYEDEDGDVDDEQQRERIQQKRRATTAHPCPPANRPLAVAREAFRDIVRQLPAIIALVVLCLMIAIPFGAAYFPIGWSNDMDAGALGEGGGGGGGDEDDIQGKFPLPGKESLGIRMALFATCMGQIVMTFSSGFDNPVAFQLLENTPFYHALAHIVVREQGYGMDALATLFFLFGLSSFLVGLLFYTLGRLELGRVVYFFPAHVLVGCIGGIGVFVITASIEVTNNQAFSFDFDGLEGFVDHIHLFSLVILFEAILRILSAVLVDKDGNPKFTFLAPIYFCSIVPVFYIGLYLTGLTTEQAREWGYLFPDPSCSGGADCASMSFHDKVFNGHVLDIFRIVDFRLISWTAVKNSFGTIAALCSFSMIHVPINIPAFAVSSNVDVDMNKELMSHGYSNMISGMFGGLQNVMTYSFSVLFQKSGGGGIPSCLAVATGTAILFIYGPAIAVFFPRCMAGTLLLHIGLDLFLEGSYDSYGNFDALEYAGIWFIIIVMSTFGMSAGLLAGILSAVSTYAVQSIQNIKPIFRIMHATTLRSSSWERPSGAMEILDSPKTGRARILIFQLQGHLFFGNAAELTETVKKTLASKAGTDDHPYIVILDFSLVVGIDSSAAHSIAKLKGLMHKRYHVEVSIFVTGSHRDGFPCNFSLSKALAQSEAAPSKESVDYNEVATASPNPSRARQGSVTVLANSKSIEAVQVVRDFPKNRVCTRLDDALIFAEDILVARTNPLLLLTATRRLAGEPFPEEEEVHQRTEQEERELAAAIMESIVPMELTPGVKRSILIFVSKCVREEYKQGDIIWNEGDTSDSAKILLSGTVCATIEGTTVREYVAPGNIIGELGLVDGARRLSTVTCSSKVIVVYSLQRKVFDQMVQSNQLEARLLERIAIRYLAHRVQHVSNRIFDTHCLPI